MGSPAERELGHGKFPEGADPSRKHGGDPWPERKVLVHAEREISAVEEQRGRSTSRLFARKEVLARPLITDSFSPQEKKNTAERKEKEKGKRRYCRQQPE